jgi:hypothetical protein
MGKLSFHVFIQLPSSPFMMLSSEHFCARLRETNVWAELTPDEQTK